MNTPTAGPDQHVRPAMPADAPLLSQIQVAAWRHAHFDLLGPQVLDLLNLEAMTAAWTQAITNPPARDCEVLVACQRNEVVGMASLAGRTILSLEVLPEQQRSGHGSRLLMACVDRLRFHEHTEAVTWVMQDSPARERFFAGAGFGQDGGVRTLATGVREVQEHRWAADITP